MWSLCSARYVPTNTQGPKNGGLEYWRKVHMDFLTRELAEINKIFTENTLVVCEEFELVYT